MIELDSPNLPPLPETLEEAVEQILALMDDDLKAEVKAISSSREFATALHFNASMTLRNEWGLWKHTTPLARWFLERRLYHADDRSATVTQAVWRRLNGLPIDDEWVATQALFYETHWRNHGLTWDQQSIPDWKAPKNGWKYLRDPKTGDWTPQRDDSDDGPE